MRCLAPLLLLTVTALPCFAADSPWNGTWKLNRDKSQMTGATVTFTRTGSMYHLTNGPASFSFACDGKDYPAIGDRTLSCTQDGNVYHTTMKAAGKLITTTVHTLSADGNTITEQTEGTRPDGTSFTRASTSQRVGSGQGLVGTWKEVETRQTAPTSMVIQWNGDTLHMEDPGYKEVSDTKLDGTPAPLVGPTAPPGAMISTRSEGPNKVLVIYTLGGKEFTRDEMILSPDGSTLTDVSWLPGKESEKLTFIYEKQ